jgi:hypothetical protein
MQKMEEYNERTGRILSISGVAGNKVAISFKTVDGEMLRADVPADTEGIKDFRKDDVVYLEYFQREDFELVRIETIAKMSREIIYHNSKSLDDRKFHIRRAETVQRDLGYRALYVDKDQEGLPAKALFLMNDGSLLVVTYKGTEAEEQMKTYVSAREYLTINKRALESAGRFDAIHLLAKELDRTN